MEHKDSRLPNGITIWANAFGEFVAAEQRGQVVAQIDRKNVKAARTLEEAIQHYLNKKTA